MDHSNLSALLKNSTNFPDQRSNAFVIYEYIPLAVFLSSFSLVTIFGNSLVTYAVVSKSYLQTPAGYLIVSLAIADLIVGTWVMPFNISIQITPGHRWEFGLVFCDIWHCLDVLASTASIWNLCVISLDRFLAIRDPLTYRDIVTLKKVMIAIGGVWLCSVIISFPAVAWWRAASPELYTNPDRCIFTDDIAYVIFSSLVSFYLPMVVILFAYSRVYIIASKHGKSVERGRKMLSTKKKSTASDPPVYIRIHRGGASSSTPAMRKESLQLQPRETPCLLHVSPAPSLRSLPNGPVRTPEKNLSRRDVFAFEGETSSETSRLLGSITKEDFGQGPECPQGRLRDFFVDTIPPTPSGARKAGKLRPKPKVFVKFMREKRAAKTLGIVVGCFLVCWLPFFVVNILVVACPTVTPNLGLVFTVVTWLGHCNSALNPLIYSLSNREFRRAFKQILCQRHRRYSTRKGMGKATENVLRVMVLQFGRQAELGSAMRQERNSQLSLNTAGRKIS